MANNCDYCHKPLSLMRRLRGEQFCSIEHMELYAAQQAEFALERLAASVTDRPNTERPPSLNRPAPKLRPKSAPVTSPVMAPVQAQPDVPVAVALQEHEPQAVAEPALTEQAITEEVIAQPEVRPVEPLPAPRVASTEVEYPMAAYLTQHPEAKSSNFPKVRKEAEFAPVEHWGKVAPAWSMPPFHSEPGEVRTWNAGKLVSQIPPVAGMRELLSPLDVEPVEPATDADAEPPTLTVTVEQLAALPAKAELHNIFPKPLTQLRSLKTQRGTMDAAIQAEYPAEFAWGGPQLGAVAETVPNAFHMTENRLEISARILPTVRPQTLTVEWSDLGGAQFAPPVPVHGTIEAASPGVQGLEPADLQRRQWSDRAGIATALSGQGVTMGPTSPEAAFALPIPEGWNWTESFDVPVVSLPELTPAPLAQPDGLTDPTGGWQELRGTLRNPSVQWMPPHLGYSGPAFGWESIAGKPAPDHSATGLEQACFTHLDALPTSPRTWALHARLRAKLATFGLRALPRWSTPKLDAAKLEVGPLVNLRPTVASMPVQVRPLVPVGTARLESVPGAAFTLALSKGRAPAVLVHAAAAGSAGPAVGDRIAIPGPIPALRSAKAALRSPKTHGADTGKISHTGPLKYSPVALVVMPPPQFALLPAVIRDEQRYAAQVPNGVWHLPRVRHTGYRALGPFPKQPLRLPDRYLKTAAPEVPSPFTAIPLQPVVLRQDLAGMPVFTAPRPMGVHAADYLAWPEPKGLKTTRALPEQQDLPRTKPVARRFGPGRAGLQGRNRSADGQARGSA